jgi:hypothetical protein
MKLNICKDFVVAPTEYGARVITPFRFPDNDHVVVWVKKSPNGFQIDDNGEAALRLASDNVDVDSDRVQAWLEALPHMLGVRWNDTDESLATTANASTLEEQIIAVTQAAIQMSALSALRQDRGHNDFKEKVVAVLQEIANEGGFEIERDKPTDEAASFIADVWLKLAKPVAVVAASTVQRLLEAEVMYMDAKSRGAPFTVLALVESVKAVGVKQYTRANYYTDKTVEFSGKSLLKDLIIPRGTA